MEVWPAALTVFGVFLREGVEVMILLYTMNAVAKRPLPIITGGGIGVLVTVAAGIALGEVGQSVVAGNGVSLMAAAIMLYMARGLIFWHAMVDDDDRAPGRIARLTMEPWPLFGLALILSGRETVDLMIFVEVLSLRAGFWNVPVFAAIAVAGLCLAVVYSVLDRLAGKLPLKVIFIVSSIWLVVQAALLIWDVVE